MVGQISLHDGVTGSRLTDLLTPPADENLTLEKIPLPVYSIGWFMGVNTSDDCPATGNGI